MKDINQNIPVEKKEKKKFSLGALVYPMIIIAILATFAGVVYYAKIIKPRADIDKEIGYKVEDYISLGQYTGFDYELTQEIFDQSVQEENREYEYVERAAKDKDAVEFNYTGYVDGKKDANISQNNIEFTIGEGSEGIYAQFENALKGLKEGEKVTIEVDDATELSEDGSSYVGKNVKFKIKVVAVSELVEYEITDDWVYENYFEDYGLANTEDFYSWCESYIIEETYAELWQKVLDKANMKGYPQDMYDEIVDEFTQHTNYYADEWGMTVEDYLEFTGYTEDNLEEEYLNQVKSELVMWAIVKKERFEATDAEIEAKYDEMYLEVGYETIEDMKADYTESEIREAVLLDKVQNFMYDNSNIKKTYKIPN